MCINILQFTTGSACFEFDITHLVLVHISPNNTKTVNFTLYGGYESHEVSYILVVTTYHNLINEPTNVCVPNSIITN